MAFDTDDYLSMRADEPQLDLRYEAEPALDTRAARLLDLARHRDRHFRRTVMADSAMAIMLSLFLGELKSVGLSVTTLALVNSLDDSECDAVIESLVHAGLAVVIGINPERQTVGLTALGSARMRSFVSSFPEI